MGELVLPDSKPRVRLGRADLRSLRARPNPLEPTIDAGSVRRTDVPPSHATPAKEPKKSHRSTQDQPLARRGGAVTGPPLQVRRRQV